MMPRGWVPATIGALESARILSLRNGFACGEHGAEPTGVAHLRPFNVSDECSINLQAIKYIPSRQGLDGFRLVDGDILFNNTNSEELVGKCALWTDRGSQCSYVISNHMTIIRIESQRGIDTRFVNFRLFWLWRQGISRTLCRRHVNQASIGLDRIRELELALPSIAEQWRIAAFLTKLQRRAEIERERARALAALKSATLAKIFREGLRGEPLKDSPIGPIPQSWRVAKLGELADIRSGGTPSKRRPDLWRGDVPWLSTKDRMREVGTSAHGTRKLAGSSVSNLDVPVAPRSEQDVVVGALNGLDQAEHLAARGARCRHALFHAALERLMTGEVRLPADGKESIEGAAAQEAEARG